MPVLMLGVCISVYFSNLIENVRKQHRFKCNELLFNTVNASVVNVGAESTELEHIYPLLISS